MFNISIIVLITFLLLEVFNVAKMIIFKKGIDQPLRNKYV
jgi:hypothetical protein